MLEKIIVITGKSGLFRMHSQTRTGVIATSLIDGKKTVTNPREQINVLTEIQIYGIRGEVPLEEVFNKIFVYEKGESIRITPKAKKDELEAYFLKFFKIMTKIVFMQVILKKSFNGTTYYCPKGY